MALISYNKNSYTREWEIRFISISILKFRINFEKQKGVFYIFGVPVLFLNVTAKTIEKYAKSVCHFFQTMIFIFVAIQAQEKSFN